MNCFVQRGGHAVQLYSTDAALLSPLTEFIGGGLETGDTCIVVGTSNHTIKLSKALREQQIDVANAIGSGQYIVIEAEELLQKIMRANMPDADLFIDVMEPIMMQAIEKGRPVRVFGEVVSLLLGAGNFDGLVELEHYWSQLMERQLFTLFCAYAEPELSRVLAPSQLVPKIYNCHSAIVHLGRFQTA